MCDRRGCGSGVCGITVDAQRRAWTDARTVGGICAAAAALNVLCARRCGCRSAARVEWECGGRFCGRAARGWGATACRADGGFALRASWDEALSLCLESLHAPPP